LTASVLALATLFTPQIGASQEEDPPFISGLLDLSFSNYYLTPRGVIVEDTGVIFQPLLLLFANVYQGEGALTNVTATAGVWNSIHSEQRATDTTTPSWNEMDFISALSFTWFKDWTLSVGYEYWLSPIDAFPATSLLQVRLAYSDHVLKALMPNTPGEMSVNPYVNVFIELDNKAAADANTVDESYYIEIGLTPKYVFAGYPMSIELPTYVTFPGDHFYSQDSTLGVFGTGARVTLPLTFMRERYGKWSVHFDLIYKHLFNDGVVADNANALPPHNDTRNPVQAVGGLTLSF
jgi:hypothetical protein